MLHRLPHRKLRQRLVLGAALSVSLAHCKPSSEPSEPSENLPTDPSTSEGTDTTGDTGSDDTTDTSVTDAPGAIKLPAGVDKTAIKHWFIELEGVPLAEAGDPEELDVSMERFRKSAFDATLKFKERFRFNGLVHGVSVEMSHLELGKLGRVKGIKAVYPVGMATLPKATNQARPFMKNAVKLTGADIVQNDLGFDGTGIRVGVIDSGIDVDHPDFHVGGTLAGASRIDLTRSYDFVGDDYDAGGSGDALTPHPDNNPDDCGGHGTHVAGIIGASGNPTTGVTGVAPGVTFQSYRVFGCDGSVNDDVIAAAIERAVEDGADVINLSLGSDNGWGSDFSALALSRATDLGVVAVAAAGNNGSNGPWTVGSPGGGEHTITVASVDNGKLRASYAELNDAETTDIPYDVMTGAPPAPATGTAFGPIVNVGRGCNADTLAADPSGKVALISRGVCTFAEKYLKAKAAGAIGVIVHQAEDRKDESFGGTLGEPPAGQTFNIPGITITWYDAQKIIAVGDNATITFRGIGEFDSPNAGKISSFSSWGPTPELFLKPDVAAPGGDIRSTWPLSRNDGESAGYAVLGGTSMASPHVAGAAALLLEAKGDITPARVINLLQNNAEPIIDPEETFEGAYSSVHQQGAGLLRIDRAIQATSLVSPSKVFAGEGENGPVEVPLYLENRSNASATYTFANVPNGVATWGNPYTEGTGSAFAAADVEFLVIGPGGSLQVADSVTIPAGAVRTVGVRITAPSTALAVDGNGEIVEFEPVDGTVYGGYFTLTPQQGATATAVSVPYAGIVGDYQAIDPVGYPAIDFSGPTPAYIAEPLIMLNDPSVIEDPAYVYSEIDVAEPGHAYSMKDGDVPAGVIKLAHGVQKFTTELVPQGKLAWLGTIPAFEVSQWRRDNADRVSAFAASDLGAGYLPDGVYRVRVKLLKALGTPTNPDHTVVLESAPFRIDRTAEPPAPPPP